jgi:hypothetical protein
VTFARFLARAFPLAPALASLACGASSPPPAPAVTTVDLSGASSSASAANADAGPPLPPDVTDAVAIASPHASCTIREPFWTGDVDLLLAADGADFASLMNAHDAELSLVEPSAAFLRASVGSATIGAYVPIAQLELQPHRPVVLGGIFVPSFEGGLAFAGVHGDRISVRAATPPGVELVGVPALTGEIACADLLPDAAAMAAFDPSTAWGGAAGLRDASFAPKRTVALSSGAADPPMLRIEVDDALALRRVTVIEQRAGRARVHWSTHEGDFFGWVSASDLRPFAQTPRTAKARALEEVQNFGMIGLLRSAGSSGDEQAPPSSRRLACRGAVRVLAEKDGRRYLLGQIAAGAPFTVEGHDEGAVTRLVAPASLLLDKSVRWLVAARDLADCATSSAQEASDEDPNGQAKDLSGTPGHAGGGGVTGGSMFKLGRADVGVALSGARSSVATPPAAGPRLREGSVTVTGRLPPEVVRRIARQNFGRFRLCYEDGLRSDPRLHGRVIVRFSIATDGSVSSSQDAGSTLPAPGVVACIVRGIGNLSFPQPEGGTVQVVYPIDLATGQ